jgi:hypothetical protein
MAVKLLSSWELVAFASVKRVRLKDSSAITEGPRVSMAKSEIGRLQLVRKNFDENYFRPRESFRVVRDGSTARVDRK